MERATSTTMNKGPRRFSSWMYCPDCDSPGNIYDQDNRYCIYYIECPKCGARWEKDVS